MFTNFKEIAEKCCESLTSGHFVLRNGETLSAMMIYRNNKSNMKPYTLAGYEYDANGLINCDSLSPYDIVNYTEQ